MDWRIVTLSLISTTLLASETSAQTTQTSAVLRGKAQLRGLAHIITTPPQQTTRIYVFNPPLSNSTGNNNRNLIQNVMNQSAIDGVTVVVAWKQVETTTDPFTGTCGSGVNDDQFQVDAAGYCHTYNWSSVDGTSCAGVWGNGTLLGQFFCSASPGPKKVNPLLFGITLNPNSATPEYLWHSSAWNTAVGTQDVVNSLRDDDAGCLGYTGYDSSTILSANMKSSGDVTVAMASSVPFKAGERIWVKGFDTSPDFNMHTSVGTTVGTIGPGNQFTYSSTCPPSPTCVALSSSIGNIIGTRSSFPVPTEKPYKTAFRAFIAAAVYHFSHGNSVVNRDQVAYMRVGHSYGAEAYPACQAQWPQDTSKDDWLNFYAEMNAFLMGTANAAQQREGTSIFHMQTSINAGGPPFSQDITYADAEAQSTVQFSGGDLRPFGFGTQGLQASDYNLAGCTIGTADWCMWFNQFWLGGPGYTNTEFELQQIDCSNPTGTNDLGLSTCFQGGGTGKTGDLRILMPWVASKQHATIVELYAQDALLAFDPNFCDIGTGSTCKATTATGDTFGGLAPTTQYTFYTHVGQGSSCGPGTANGDCYASAVNATHGLH